MARISRLFGVATATLALAVVLGACATPVEEPTPAPPTTQPSPTSSTVAGQAAFEAAEATYRAYIDAYDRAVFADPETFEPIYALATEPVLSTDRQSLADAHAKEIVKSGTTSVDWVEDGREDASDVEYVVLIVCLDVSGTDAVNSAGESIVAPDRLTKQVYELGFVPDESAEHGYLLYSREFLRGGDSC